MDGAADSREALRADLAALIDVLDRRVQANRDAPVSPTELRDLDYLLLDALRHVADEDVQQSIDRVVPDAKRPAVLARDLRITVSLLHAALKEHS